MTTWAWRGIRLLGDKRSRALRLADPIIPTLTLVMWVGFIRVLDADLRWQWERSQPRSRDASHVTGHPLHVDGGYGAF